MQVSDPYDDDGFNAWENRGEFKNHDGTAISYGVMPEGASLNLISGKRKNSFEKKESNSVYLFVLDSTIKLGSIVTLRCIATGEEIFSAIFNPDTEYTKQTYFKNDAISMRIDYIKIIERVGTDPYFIIGNSKKNYCGFVLCNINTSAID